MCAPRSVYPWDIVLIREGDKLFLDKREGGPFGAFLVLDDGDLELMSAFRLCERQRKRCGPAAGV